MSGQIRLLDLVKPFLPILPEVNTPLRKVNYEDKLIWTMGAGIIYYVMSEIPLYGIVSSDSSDPLYWVRAILASNRGTLMELGITPIVTTGLIFQLFGGAHLLDVNFDLKSDRELFQSAQKLFAIFLTIIQAIAAVFSGLYGSPSDLGAGVVALLILQLVFAGVVLILVDEVLDKGYGLGPGLQFFTTLNVCQQVFWNSFSLQSHDFGRGTEYTGCVVALFHFIWTRKNIKAALLEAFFRTHLPNLTQFYATVISFIVTTYFLTFRAEIPVKSTRARSISSSYPIRLLYTGAMPAYLLTSFTANVFMMSQSLYNQFPSNLLVRMFGTWQSREGSSQLFATSGLAYYLQPPSNIYEAIWDPIKTIVYLVFVVVACSLFAKTWAEISGSAPKDIAKLFKAQSISIVGHREGSVLRELKRIIPVAASVGGAIVGLIMVGSDLLGSFGNGTAILMAVTTIQSYFETIMEEGRATGVNPIQKMMGGR